MNKLVALALALLLCLPVFGGKYSREVYINLMEKAVEAYTPEQIDAYISEVSANGIREHGFARLTSNIGIVVAHGRHPELKERFERMMDICVAQFSLALRNSSGAGNDFAVKEVCCCLLEAEASGLFPKAETDAWRAGLTALEAESIYSVQPEPGDGTARNWCVFGSASECARIYAGAGGSRAYADRYLADQCRFFDINGMYKDPNQPILYDVVTRLQFMACLHFGYDGHAKQLLEENLMKSALHTLEFQSVTGEIPYGGRSNQFLFNEAAYAGVCEYYASWFKSRGETSTARRFKAAARRAVESIYYWLDQEPVHHIKNRYPLESGYGCESYAYFNKYMVTLGSFSYLAYLFADDSIRPSRQQEPDCTFVMSDDFHRICMRAGGYTVEFDLNAQTDYDSNGMGRFQKKGASPMAALACPGPSGQAHLGLDILNQDDAAICPHWTEYELVSAGTGKVVLTNGAATWTTRLSRKGLDMVIKGAGTQLLSIPVMEFDGEASSEVVCGPEAAEKATSGVPSSSEVTCDGSTLIVRFRGCECRYTTNGRFVDTGISYASRSGHLHRYDAVGDGEVHVAGEIRY